MKRQGEKIYDLFLKRSKSGKDEAGRQPEFRSASSSHPGTSQEERECDAHSPSSPGQSIDRNSHMLSSVIEFSFRYFEMLVTEECCFLMVVVCLF